jgi:hypothetical protein
VPLAALHDHGRVAERAHDREAGRRIGPVRRFAGPRSADEAAGVVEVEVAHDRVPHVGHFGHLGDGIRDGAVGEAEDGLRLGVERVAAAGLDEHVIAGGGGEQEAVVGGRNPVRGVGRHGLRPHRPRHDAEHRPAVKPDRPGREEPPAIPIYRATTDHAGR